MLKTLLTTAGKFIYSRYQARKDYMKLKPACFRVWENNGFHSLEGQVLFDELADTANYGAQRHNFRKYYSMSTNWKKLPDDPNDIMYGYW